MSQPLEEIVWDCLEKAVERFNRSADRDGLLCGEDSVGGGYSLRNVAGERTITHRLAVYLEGELRKKGVVHDDGPLVVDCEYNRHGNDPKSFSTEAQYEVWRIVHTARATSLSENEDGFYVFSIAPDIVVHQRRTDANNLLVVEVKRASNRESPEYDELKLKLFTHERRDERGYGYRYGAWVVVSDNIPTSQDWKMRIEKRFRDGQEVVSPPPGEPLLVQKSKEPDWDAGSRMHVLDWVESERFLQELQTVVTPTGLQVGTVWRPQGRHAHVESVLVGSKDKFLTSAQVEQLKQWWVVHRKGSKFPAWDLVATATAPDGHPALILVEAKAHAAELHAGGKEKTARNTNVQQQRTNENHARISAAIEEASSALAAQIPGVSLSAAKNYQFANRVAFSWKLASMGIPVVLVYLGFTGDQQIATHGQLLSDADWKRAFLAHTTSNFPETHLERPIVVQGGAPFWIVVRALPVKRASPPLAERRRLK